MVVDARQAVLDALAAGMTPFEAEAAVEALYDRPEVCGISCYNFTRHLLFHGVGLDVHDGGYHRFDHVAGVVFNVEPGLYFPGEGIGFRIEDTVVLTETGYVLLTTGLPTTADEIEAFMAGEWSP